ncbi:MAG: esterase/lipase family protein, partial [Flammeovirgaceae bacterium]
AFDLSAPIHLEYEYNSKKDKWYAPKFRFKIKNTSDEILYVSLVYMSEDFSANNSYLPIQKLNPGEEVYAKFKHPKIDTPLDAIPTSVPKALASWGITSINDLLKVIVSTVEFDTTGYNLESLELDVKDPKTDRAALDDDELDDFAVGNTADWTVRDVHVTVTRPLAGVSLADEDVQLHGLTVAAHSGLKAKINLSTQKEATRAVGGAKEAHKAVPAALSGNPAIQDMPLNQPQGKAAPLSILEITDVTDTSVVNEDAPLELSLDGLEENEMVLPVGYDEATGSFIPLGGSFTDEHGNTKVTIDQLPEPTPAGTRSLGGSIKILFKKVVLRKLGYKDEYPILAEGIVSQDGEDIEYNKDTEDIKAKVAKSERIVVFIHGIIGDTLDMTKAVRKGTIQENGSTKYMGDLYDLILTFDYENLNTPIEETARLFKQRLEAIGLGAGHGKTLHIVAHSMGGLVSRWMIEKEGGNEFVNHLIQLGTPNGGSAWSDVYKWAKVAMSFVLGKISISAIYMAPLSFLLKKVNEKVFVTLQQMNAESDFIKNLNGSTFDPKIPYTIICGDTSQIPRMQTDAAKKTIKAAIAKLGSDGQAKLLDDLIFKVRNDIAVSVDSIKEVSEERSPAPKKIEVACDHMSYFVTDAGLDALTETVYEIAAE